MTSVDRVLQSTGLCLLGLTFFASIVQAEDKVKVRVSVTSKLFHANVPFDPTIDFAELISQSGLSGILDPNSISVTNSSDRSSAPVFVSEEFSYGDRGRVQWVIPQPDQVNYELTFRVVDKRPSRIPATYTPPIGNGELLRFNAGAPRPIHLPYLSRLVDLTGDGKSDLVGCWNYGHRPGMPWDGVVCYPRVGDGQRWEFGELIRVRHVTDAEPTRFQHLTSVYMNVDFGDLNRDGLPDLVYSPMRSDRLSFYLNTGRRDAGGMPIFTEAGTIARPKDAWEACRIVDLNGDHVPDLVVGNHYIRNKNRDVWPFDPADAIAIDAGNRACFLDLDADERLDSVCLLPADKPGPAHPARLAWRKNLGGDSPQFGPAELLEGVDLFWPSDIATFEEDGRVGIMVQHNVFQQITFLEKLSSQGSKPRFRSIGRAESVAAEMSLSDQAWPSLCDWNDDGLLDLLIGGGYGWPRIVINRGTKERAAFAEPQLILADGKPIRVLMSDVFPGCDEYKHNMGYPYPVFTDWNGDGLPDLMLPNCSNRIFWYPNIGTRSEPKFGTQQQLNPIGFEDTPDKRAATGKILMSRWEGELEPGQPFFWRTGAAFADFNNDGLMDMITHDGASRKATLFTQQRDSTGGLSLHKQQPLKLVDHRLIDDAIVGRSAHWTESFRATDWDSDGLVDLVYSCSGSTPKGSIYLLRNVGTKEQPVFDAPRTLSCFGEPIFVTLHGPHPSVGDFDGDGHPDLIACTEWSVYPFYRHAALEMAVSPSFQLEVIKGK